MDVVVERARTGDLPEVLRLLAENTLPPEGLREHFSNAVVARNFGRIVGCAALEVYADGALVRSVAVAQALQGHGLGRQLTEAIIALAHEIGVPAVYLLTTTAERYFPKFGFEPVTREVVPDSVQASVEFTSACPSTAVVMRKVLSEQTGH